MTAALISDSHSQRPGQMVYHLNNGDGQPLCNCRGDAEYTAVSLADAKSQTARRCRNCQIARQGEQDTRPCPHCTTEIKLRACTDMPTDATEETDPGDDPASTDTQPATRSTAHVSARVHTTPSQK